MNESTTFVISRILFLDNYFSSGDKSSWNWPNVVKMHAVGSLMLQSIFRFPSVCISILFSLNPPSFIVPLVFCKQEFLFVSGVPIADFRVFLF